MRIFGLGLPELIIILVVVVVIFGPGLFKKLNKQLKKTGDAAKAGIESGTEAAGKKVDLDDIKKDDILDKIESLQDKMDEKLDEYTSELDKADKE